VLSFPHFHLRVPTLNGEGKLRTTARSWIKLTMPDLVRTRAIAVEDYRRKRQHVTSFLLRHGRSYDGKATWRGRHKRWLDGQSFAHPAQRLAYQEMLNAVQTTVERLDRLEAALIEIIPAWTMAPIVEAFQAMRGVQVMTAVTMVAEAGDLRRFDHLRQLMAFLGLVPSERSTGETRRLGGITKAGNASARKALVEAAWTSPGRREATSGQFDFGRRGRAPVCLHTHPQTALGCCSHRRPFG
jgi:transposase